MTLNLPQPPTLEEIAAAELATTTAAHEEAVALAAYNAAAAKTRLAKEAETAVMRHKEYAARCAKLAENYAGSLVQREDKGVFGALIGKGAQRRTLRTIPTYGSDHYSDVTIHAVSPGVWSDYPNGRGYVWREVTE